jgi:hypothetical protein
VHISKVCVVHPSLQAPTHARAVVVKRILLLYNPHSGSQKGEKIAVEAKELFLAAKIDVRPFSDFYTSPSFEYFFLLC